MSPKKTVWLAVCVLVMIPQSSRAAELNRSGVTSEDSSNRVRRGAGDKPSKTVATNTLCALSSLIPYAGSFICALLNILWPEDAAADLWTQVEQKVTTLINSTLLAFETRLLQAKLTNVKERMESYVRAGNDEKGSIMATLLHGCGEMYHMIQQSPNNHQLIDQVILLGALHVGVLRERNASGQVIYPSQSRTTAFWEAELTEWDGRYQDLLGKVYGDWLIWRRGKVTVKNYSYARRVFETKDELTDKVLYTSNYYECPRFGRLFGDCDYRMVNGNSETVRIDAYDEGERKGLQVGSQHLSELREKMVTNMVAIVQKTAFHTCHNTSDASTTECSVHLARFVGDALEPHGYGFLILHKIGSGVAVIALGTARVQQSIN